MATTAEELEQRARIDALRAGQDEQAAKIARHDEEIEALLLAQRSLTLHIQRITGQTIRVVPPDAPAQIVAAMRLPAGERLAEGVMADVVRVAQAAAGDGCLESVLRIIVAAQHLERERVVRNEDGHRG